MCLSKLDFFGILCVFAWAGDVAALACLGRLLASLPVLVGAKARPGCLFMHSTWSFESWAKQDLGAPLA